MNANYWAVLLVFTLATPNGATHGDDNWNGEFGQLGTDLAGPTAIAVSQAGIYFGGNFSMIGGEQATMSQSGMERSGLNSVLESKDR